MIATYLNEGALVRRSTSLKEFLKTKGIKEIPYLLRSSADLPYGELCTIDGKPGQWFWFKDGELEYLVVSHADCPTRTTYVDGSVIHTMLNYIRVFVYSDIGIPSLSPVHALQVGGYVNERTPKRCRRFTKLTEDYMRMLASSARSFRQLLQKARALQDRFDDNADLFNSEQEEEE